MGNETEKRGMIGVEVDMKRKDGIEIRGISKVVIKGAPKRVGMIIEKEGNIGIIGIMLRKEGKGRKSSQMKDKYIVKEINVKIDINFIIDTGTEVPERTKGTKKLIDIRKNTTILGNNML